MKRVDSKIAITPYIFTLGAFFEWKIKCESTLFALFVFKFKNFFSKCNFFILLPCNELRQLHSFFLKKFLTVYHTAVIIGPSKETNLKT